MAVSFQTSYEVETPTVSHSLPISCQAGDLIILQCISDNSYNVMYWPSGFTQQGLIQMTADSGWFAVATKVATGSETTLDVSMDTESIASYLIFRGVDTTTPIDVTTVTSLGTTASSPFSHNASITPVTNNSMLVACVGWDTTSAPSTVSAAFSGGSLSWTTALNTDQASGYRHMACGYAAQSTAAAVTVTATGTASGVDAQPALVILAVRPGATTASILAWITA